ncbi:MAG: hypothetical protein U0359_22975 [Byssovorax sp.]
MATKTADELERELDAAEQAFTADPIPTAENEAALRAALRASGKSDEDVDPIVHALRYAGFGLM